MGKLSVIDLFAGIGGFSLGLENAGSFETVAFCEIDPSARRVLRRHWNYVDRLEDIRTVDRKQVTSYGRIFAITAGFPCQDISTAGPGTGLAGERSGLFWHVVRAVRFVRPAVVLLENVAALLSRGMGEVLGAMAEEGYDAEWDCIRAFDVAKPHVRERVFIAAHSEAFGWRSRRPWGLADGLAGIPIETCWGGDPVATFEERFSQPALLGVDDGIPGGLERIALCGNSVVPKIPELIGRAILDALEAA